jgi:amidase
MPARPTTDTLGPVTRTVRDAAIVLDVIAGYDPEDPITCICNRTHSDFITTFLAEERLQGGASVMDPRTDPSSAD